jgi:hypothetical protein
METITRKIQRINISNEYLLQTPPSILSSTNFILTGFGNNEIIDIINNFIKNENYIYTFLDKKYWIINKSYKNDLDFPYCEYMILIYLKNNEHIIEVFKLFGKDDLFEAFFQNFMNIFR